MYRLNSIVPISKEHNAPTYQRDKLKSHIIIYIDLLCAFSFLLWPYTMKVLEAKMLVLGSAGNVHYILYMMVIIYIPYPSFISFRCRQDQPHRAVSHSHAAGDGRRL